MIKEVDSCKNTERPNPCCQQKCCQGPEGPQGPQGPPGPPGEADFAWFYGWQVGTLRNSALFGGLKIENSDYTEGFFFDDTVIYITEPGVYNVHYSVFVPQNVSLNTKIALQSNNANVPGMVVDIDHPAGSASAVYSSEGIIRVDDSAGMRLSSSRVINYVGQTDSVTLASIVIMRISK